MRKALDLFCGAGGATRGLQRAGFAVHGIDIKYQPHYCGEGFTQADAVEYGTYEWFQQFDFVWASPPCQAHSRLNGINRKKYRDFIGPIRSKLIAMRVPFVIENVIGAPLESPIMLCGSMFALGVWRHRLFELHGFTMQQQNCEHATHPLPLDVTGTGGPCPTRTTKGGGIHRKPKSMAEASRAMGIDWMTRKEIVEAIPPAYSLHVAQGFLRTQ